ncbi:hypothetical protein B1A99_03120 [Cohnella sp. CIP 111063]|nr:hypothetical protein B1A99_03120 [Cohnella sp. CIP 111063]PRX74040.1 hypothetical protein B0G52_10264 [Cohnella sp. SGD-V74]
MLESGYAVVPVLIVHDETSRREEETILYRAMKRRADRSARTMKRRSLRSILPDVPVVEWSEGSSDRLGELSAYRLDAILSFRQGPSVPELAGICKYGVWEFAYGEERLSSVFDYSFRCLLNREPTVTVSLIRRETGTYAVLKEGTVRAKLQSYFRNIDTIHDAGLDLLSYACRDLTAGNASYLERWREAEIFARESTVRGTVIEAMKISWTMLGRKARNLVRHWLVAEHWNVGIVNKPIQAFLDDPDTSRAEWMPKRDAYAADPFGICANGVGRIMYEEFDYRTGKGVLRTAEHDGRFLADGRETNIELPVHLSYPYLFSDGERIYCIPESHQASMVSLYRADDFPHGWVKVRDILHGFRATDSSIIRHEGRWWLFCTDEAAGPDSHLHIWYASELEGEWLPHPMNPAKVDIRSARPAGTPFYRGNSLYRPAQDCAETYGAAVMLNRIITLTTEEFAETAEARLAPDPNGPYPAGLHTLSAIGDRTLLDSKTETVNWRVFSLRLRDRLRDGLERLKKRKQNPALSGRIEEKEGCYAE